MDYERERDLIPRLRDLIKHRDNVFTAEHKQVNIVLAKNEALRRNLDQVCL